MDDKTKYNAEIRQTPEMEALTIPAEESLKLAEEHEEGKDGQG